MEILETRKLRGPNYWSGYWKKLVIMSPDGEESEDSKLIKSTGFAIARCFERLLLKSVSG